MENSEIYFNQVQCYKSIRLKIKYFRLSKEPNINLEKYNYEITTWWILGHAKVAAHAHIAFNYCQPFHDRGKYERNRENNSNLVRRPSLSWVQFQL